MAMLQNKQYATNYLSQLSLPSLRDR